MSDLEELTQAIVKFRDERDWEKFHDSRNLATAISIEAAELNELFLWKTIAQSNEVSRDKIAAELADVLIYSFLLAHKLDLPVKKIVLDKIKQNAEKYPVNKSFGNSTKYTEL